MAQLGCLCCEQMCDVRIVQFSCLLNADWFNQNSEALRPGTQATKEKDINANETAHAHRTNWFCSKEKVPQREQGVA